MSIYQTPDDAIKARNAIAAAQARIYGSQNTLSSSKDSLEHQTGERSHDYTCAWGMHTGYVGCLYSRASLSLLHRRNHHRVLTPEKRVTRPNMLLLTRKRIPADYFLEKVHRNSMTGMIVVEGAEDNLDFSFIDLLSRDSIEDLPDKLLQDEFLLVPIPLAHRTWRYQSIFEFENSAESLVDHWRAGQRSIRTIDEIRQESLEVAIWDYRPKCKRNYSPSIPCVLALLLSCFTFDTTLFAFHCILVYLTARLSLVCNRPNRLWLERPCSLLIRLSVVAWICMAGLETPTRRGKPLTTSSIPPIIRLLTGFAIFVDIIISDLITPILRRARTRAFKVVDILPGKVYICQVEGYGSTYSFSESILGSERFQTQQVGISFALVVDIQGILFELRPSLPRDFPEPIKTVKAIQMYPTGSFNVDNQDLK
jgi:hypothetical protein